MPSAYSTLNTYNEIIPPVDLSLMAKAMEVKQTKFDTNYAAIQSQLDLIGSMDLIKSEDKEYVYERTKQLVSQIPMGTDLSNSSLSMQIKNHIKQAIDTNVSNALTSTASFRAFQNEIKTIKEKNPEQYSVINEMYALRPYMQWVNDGKAGTKMGSLSYTPYSDPNKKIQTILKDAMTSRGTYKFQERDPNNEFGIIEKEYSGLDENLISNIVNNMLSPQERQQLSINGWYNMGGASNEQAISIRDKYIKQQKNAYDGNVIILNEQINKTADPIKKQELIKQRDGVIAMSNKFKDIASDPGNYIGNTAEQIGYFMESQKLLSGAISLYGRELKSLTTKADEAYSNKINAMFKEREYQLDLAMFDFEKNKFQTERQDKLNEKNLLDQQTAILVPGAGDTLTEINTYDDAVIKTIQDEKGINTRLEDAIRSQYTNKDEADKVIDALMDKADKSGTEFSRLALDSIKDLRLKGSLGAELWDIKARKEKLYNMLDIDADLKKIGGNYTKDDLILAFNYLANTTTDEDKKNIYEAKVLALGGNRAVGALPSVTDVFFPKIPGRDQGKPSPRIAGIVDRLQVTDGQIQNFNANLEKFKRVVVNDAYNFLPQNSKFQGLYGLATSQAGTNFNKDLPIQVSKVEGGKVRLTQWDTDTKKNPKPLATADIDAQYVQNILGEDYDFTGKSISRKKDYTDMSFRMEPYLASNNAETNDNVKTYFSTTFGANADSMRKMVYSDDIKQIINTSLASTSPVAQSLLTRLVDRADEFTLNTKKSPYSGNIIVNITDNSGNMVGSTTIPAADFERLDKGVFFSSPQIIMSRVIESYIKDVLNFVPANKSAVGPNQSLPSSLQNLYTILNQ